MSNGSVAVRVVVSGGVFQNALLLEMLHAALGDRMWSNTAVPANDGGLSLGQAALVAAEKAQLEHNAGRNERRS